MKKTLLISLALLLAAGIPLGLYLGGFLNLGGAQAEGAGAEDGHGAGAASAATLYLPLEPPFVVNFMHRGTLRYLQVSLEVMYHSEALIEKVKASMPAIRNELILMFSGQEFERLNSQEGKEELRGEVRSAINRIIKLDENAPDQGEVYITNFIMQ